MVAQNASKTKMADKDSITSTWPLDNRSKWGFNHHLINLLNAYPVTPGTTPPIHQKAEKVPYIVEWKCHVWVLIHAFIPMALHHAYATSTGQNLGAVAAGFLYFAAFSWIVIRQVKCARRAGEVTGYLDGDAHDRDGIPDVGVDKVAATLWKTTGGRIAMATYLTYDTLQSPADVLTDGRWWAWLALQIGLYGIILDFWFYLYHRAMHDIGGLWKYHRTHHLTKHPNSLMAAYADHEQEFFDMVGIPFMTWATFRAFGIPLGFYDWWICHQYIAFTEVLGHSGLRAYGTPPSTLTWALRMFNAELAIEDHDLHHRKGWRKSHNYGKQTKLWDGIFGTGLDRMESKEHNIDWDTGIHFPLI